MDWYLHAMAKPSQMESSVPELGLQTTEVALAPLQDIEGVLGGVFGVVGTVLA